MPPTGEMVDYLFCRTSIENGLSELALVSYIHKVADRNFFSSSFTHQETWLEFSINHVNSRTNVFLTLCRFGKVLNKERFVSPPHKTDTTRYHRIPIAFLATLGKFSNFSRSGSVQVVLQLKIKKIHMLK